MPEMMVRKIVVQIEETHSDFGRPVDPPSRKATVAAVIRNPFAGRYVEDLAELYALGAEVSTLLVKRAMDALGAGPDDITGYGKAAIIGTDGEIEHAAALIHPKFGAPVRSATGGKDIIPSTKKIGAPGAAITFPLTGKTSIWSFDDMDASEIAIPDAPRADEAVVVLALGIGGRPLHRIKLPDA
ncbi:amino acid synthesis family protein [Methylopila turkensis]|uniref:Peptide synthetase n=1 Tax=Methylopila turkensis TaxID=1437816 RepID=A0A9W6JPJ6_9HYPH|nr:amino acid synthesis family protein [Methylopila turkensis]GLK79519.1 hypothetical protein GCM10008174_12600 [Methylopila turkensis]